MRRENLNLNGGDVASSPAIALNRGPSKAPASRVAVVTPKRR